MNARILTLLGLALMLIAVALVWAPLVTSLEVDGCLDAGGSFDYAQGACDFQNAHTYAPKDNTLQLQVAAVLAVVGVAVTIVGRYRRNKEIK